MIDITAYLQHFKTAFPSGATSLPWEIAQQVARLIEDRLKTLDNKDYVITGNIAVHKTAKIEDHVTLKGPLIISENCFLGANAYLRGGVFLGEKVNIGPGCEIKSCIILRESTLAHFNFAGDSLIGSNVNMEAGAVIANHYNERVDKEIRVCIEDKIYNTKATKFGAIIGDNARIGANAVLSPGTILKPGSIVGRLTLIKQAE